jgi:RimJ/RimL family protein N-acetyltransferase
VTENIKPILLDVPAELIGERIDLRAFGDDHAPALWDAVDASREHLKPWMPWVHDHNSAEFAREYVRRMQAKWILREDMPMGIWRKEDNQLLGASGLHRIDWAIPAMEIGYWLRPDAQGNGYVTEAVNLITQFAFRHLLAERVTIRCNSKNLRSAAVPRRAGFVHEATMRHERRDAEGHLGDTELFAMTRADFDKRHG